MRSLFMFLDCCHVETSYIVAKLIALQKVITTLTCISINIANIANVSNKC